MFKCDLFYVTQSIFIVQVHVNQVCCKFPCRACMSMKTETSRSACSQTKQMQTLHGHNCSVFFVNFSFRGPSLSTVKKVKNVSLFRAYQRKYTQEFMMWVRTIAHTHFLALIPSTFFLTMRLNYC